MTASERKTGRDSRRHRSASSASRHGEVYVSVDVEASGPVPGVYSMLAVGACVVGSPERAFYAELKPINANAVPAALAVNRLDLDQLAANGRDPSEALAALRTWIQDVSRGQRPVCVGFNACFDWAFLNWYFHTFLGDNPFGIGGLDIKAYYMGLTGCAWGDTSSSRLPKRFQPMHPSTHNALDDARAQAEIFEKLLAAERPASLD